MNWTPDAASFLARSTRSRKSGRLEGVEGRFGPVRVGAAIVHRDSPALYGRRLLGLLHAAAETREPGRFAGPARQAWQQTSRNVCSASRDVYASQCPRTVPSSRCWSQAF